jgi:hypothetical protein
VETGDSDQLCIATHLCCFLMRRNVGLFLLFLPCVPDSSVLGSLHSAVSKPVMGISAQSRCQNALQTSKNAYRHIELDWYEAILHISSSVCLVLLPAPSSSSKLLDALDYPADGWFFPIAVTCNLGRVISFISGIGDEVALILS